MTPDMGDDRDKAGSVKRSQVCGEKLSLQSGSILSFFLEDYRFEYLEVKPGFL